MKRSFMKAAIAAGALVLSSASVASAHVTVNPRSTAGGGYAELNFRVPTESDTASTTKLEVFFPADQPLAFAAVKPMPGWKITVAKAKPSKPISSDDGPVAEVVSSITWTAVSPADAIKPGEFNDFAISAGALPESGTMTFKALQTYSDGSVVRWIEVANGGAEPEHPAPVLTLTSAAPAQAAAPSSDSDGTAKTALGFGIGGLVAGLAALGLGLRRRKA
jgi:periplasmic copper chaperone A